MFRKEIKAVANWMFVGYLAVQTARGLGQMTRDLVDFFRRPKTNRFS